MKRDQSEKKTALLVTNDPAVETTVRSATSEAGMKLQLLRTAREAVSEVRDSFAGESFAIVDLDGRSGTRLLLQTAAGTLPVIAITGRQWRWVTSMLRHHRIGATISKPVTMEALQAALARIHDFHLMSDFSGN